MAQNKTLLYAGLAVGAYLAYRWYEKNKMIHQGVPGLVAPGPASTLTNPTNIPSSGVIAPPPPALSAHLQSWISRYEGAHPSLTPNLTAALSMMSPADIQMLDQVTSAFDNNQPLTSGQSGWWNTFINQYGLG